MLKYVNIKRFNKLVLSERDLVYLIYKNVKIKRLSLKLNYIKLGPFKIKEKKGLVTFILDLLKDMKIHLNESLLIESNTSILNIRRYLQP